MATAIKTKEQKQTRTGTDYGRFFGEMYAFNNSLKLFHWHVSGPGSYAQHMALDEALTTLADAMDRIVETTYAMKGEGENVSFELDGNIEVVIPQTNTPRNIETHCEKFFKYIDEQREMFEEDFSTAILDDYQEAIQQLLYRLKRLQ